MGDQQKPPPVWSTPSFWGLLCDPFAQGTMLEAGEIVHGVHGIARVLQDVVLKDQASKEEFLPGFGPANWLQCDQLMPLLKACFDICENASKIQEPPQLTALAVEIQTRIRGMNVNDVLLLPGGWNDGFRHKSKVTFVVVKTGQTARGSEYTFVTCNSGMGKRYHLSKATDDAELLYATCLELDRIPGAKMEDPCFISFLLSQPMQHEGHREETLYEALLPWLGGKPLLQALTAERIAAAEFRTPACANTSSSTSVLEAVLYILRRRGLTEPQVARFEFALRLAHARAARADLQKLQEATETAAAIESVIEKLRSITLVDNTDTPRTLEGVDVVGLLFGAHWCPPCNTFTPELIQAYNRMRAAGARLQIVYVSSDRSANAFAGYFGTMPWLCVPYPEQQAREDLGRMCNVSGIPNLTFVRLSDGAMIADGRLKISRNEPFSQWFGGAAAGNAANAAAGQPDNADNAGAGEQEAPPQPEPEEEKLTLGEARIIRFGTTFLAKLAVDEHAALLITNEELTQVSALVDDIEARISSLLPAAAVAEKLLPPAIAATVAAPLADLGNSGLLLKTGEDKYRGERTELRPFAHVNLLALPSRADIVTPEAAIDALELCGQMVVQLMDNAMKANAVVTQRLATEHLAIQLLCNCLTEVVPMPVPPEGDRSDDIWAVQMTQENQVRGMRAVWRAMHQLALLFQDIDTPSRTFDSQRAVASMCGLAVLDAVARTRASDNVMALTEMLSEDGGFSISLDIGRQSRTTVDVGSATFELASTQLCDARNAALAYLTAIKGRCRNELFSLNQTNEMDGATHGYSIKVDRYDSAMGPSSAYDSHATVATMRFVANYVERMGYPVMPRNQRLPSEMHALLGWLFGHHPERSGSDVPFKTLADEHPEWPMFRDTCIVFKFLSSMISEQQEIFMVKRGGGGGGRRSRLMRSFRLAFETEDTNTRMRDFGARLQNCPPFDFGLLTYIPEMNRAYMFVYGFGGRKVLWGEGVVLKSPARRFEILNAHEQSETIDLSKATEEDILHRDILPQFNHTLSVEEAEALLSYLTVEYCRLPLVTHFFADLQWVKDEAAPTGSTAQRLQRGNRAQYMFNDKLQSLFRAVLLEQGTWVAEADSLRALIERVPIRRTQQEESAAARMRALDARVSTEQRTLGTPRGTLLNELQFSPDAFLTPFLEMLRFTLELSDVSVHSASANFILFFVELAVTVESFLVACVDDPRECFDKQRARLVSLRAELSKLLRRDVFAVLQKWLDEAHNEVSREGVYKGNLPTCVVVRSYMALVWSNMREEEMNTETVSIFLGSMAFVRGNHTYGQTLRCLDLTMEEHADEKLVKKKVLDEMVKFLQGCGIEPHAIKPEYLMKFITGAPVWYISGSTILRVPMPGITTRRAGFPAPPVEVPEDHLAFVLQNNRATIVRWMMQQTQATVDAVLQTAVQIRMVKKHRVTIANWTAVGPAMPGMWVSPDGDTMVNMQTGEVLLKNAEFRPVPESMAAFADFEAIFGKESLQCAHRFQHTNRTWVEIINSNHELMEWTEHDWKDQGVGVPAPVPSLAFPQQQDRGAIRSLFARAAPHLVNNAGNQTPFADCLIAIYFSRHSCGPCRQFTPRLADCHSALKRRGANFEVVWISVDETEEAAQQ